MFKWLKKSPEEKKYNCYKRIRSGFVEYTLFNKKTKELTSFYDVRGFKLNMINPTYVESLTRLIFHSEKISYKEYCESVKSIKEIDNGISFYFKKDNQLIDFYMCKNGIVLIDHTIGNLHFKKNTEDHGAVSILREIFSEKFTEITYNQYNEGLSAIQNVKIINLLEGESTRITKKFNPYFNNKLGVL